MGGHPTPHKNNLTQKFQTRTAIGPNEIYKPYLERFYAFKTPVLRTESGGGGFPPPPL